MESSIKEVGGGRTGPAETHTAAETAVAVAPGRARLLGFAYGIVLVAIFGRSIVHLAIYAAGTDLHSHILLVPFISAYLLVIGRERFPQRYVSSPGWAALAAAISATAFVTAAALHSRSPGISENDYLGLVALSFVCALAAGGFAFFGRRWMTAAAFPICFLLFMIPMPDAAVICLENASKDGSAQTAEWLFAATNTPYLRDGAVFQLPGIVIEVARECSGIRSSWVLFITSLLASHLFLRTTWRRAVLVLFVIPLGLLRNGFRILVIGLLCVHVSPRMINSIIHHRGGPLFFILSLIPLFGLLSWLRTNERNAEARSSESAADAA